MLETDRPESRRRMESMMETHENIPENIASAFYITLQEKIMRFFIEYAAKRRLSHNLNTQVSIKDFSSSRYGHTQVFKHSNNHTSSNNQTFKHTCAVMPPSASTRVCNRSARAQSTPLDRVDRLNVGPTNASDQSDRLPVGPC